MQAYPKGELVAIEHNGCDQGRKNMESEMIMIPYKVENLILCTTLQRRGQGAQN